MTTHTSALGFFAWGALCLLLCLCLFSAADAAAHLDQNELLAWSEELVDGENGDCKADIDRDRLTAALPPAFDQPASPTAAASSVYHHIHGHCPLSDTFGFHATRPPPPIGS